MTPKPLLPESKARKIMLLLLAALSLCGAAFYNGFPIVYSDTGTYLESGFTLETPFDRPITYGIFLRIFSLNGFSLWPVIFTQSLLLVLVMYGCVKAFVNTRRAASLTCIITLALACFTGVSWMASELIADVFAPISLLCILLLLFAPQEKKGWTIFLYATLLVSTASHISHVIIDLLFLSCMTIFWLRKRKKETLRFGGRTLAGIFLVTVAAIFTMGSSIGKSKHVFMMGRLLESGILDAYLDENCGKEKLKLCDCRDRLPDNADNFLWNTDGDSVLIRTGGWQGSKAEYSMIIRHTLASPKYLLLHAKAATINSLKQLATIRVGEGNGAYGKGTLVYERIKKYFPYEFRQYCFSQQTQNYFAQLPFVNFVNYLVTGVALLLVMSWLLFYREGCTIKGLTAFVIALLLGYVLNCAVCASLATLANRFGSRESWMIVFAAIVVTMEFVSRKKTINT